MSFGFSIGDIIAVSRLARQIWKGFSESPDQCRAIRSEVAGLFIVLDDVADSYSTSELDDRQKADVATLIQGCQDVLCELDAILSKHSILEQNTSGLKAKSKKVWERFKWDQAEMTELRARLISHTNLLDTFNGSLSCRVTRTIKTGVDDLGDRLDTMQIKNANQERETIIGWLSPLDFRPQHQDFIQRREPGTGQRFLNSEHFKKWSTGKHCNLFCPGIPGAGKTIMAATVVDHLETTSEISVDNDIGIIYLYCNYRRQLEQTAPNLLGSLASQLARQRPGLSEELQALYKRHVDKKSRPNIDDLLQLIQVEIGRFSQVFIVLDALDECVNAHDTRKTLASNLRDITQKVPANLLVTSRFIPEATNLFEDCPQLEIRAQAEDVEAYLTAQLERLPKFVMRNLELQNTIVTTVAKAVDGMFLLAQLHLDSLTDKTTPKAMKAALQRLPKGSDALKIAYDSAVERIDSQKAGLRDLADLVLSWITVARRPLRMEEIQQALAIEIDEPRLDKDNICDIEEMIGVCAGLVTIDENSKVIRYIHYTTQEYFESIRATRFPNAGFRVAASCVTYLLYEDLDRFDWDAVKKRGVFPALPGALNNYIFSKYSAEHWGHHAREASSAELEQLVMRLLHWEKRLRYCLTLGRRYLSIHMRSSPSIGLFIASSFGLESACRGLIAEGADVNCKLDGETALYVACCHGYEGVVRILLDAGADVELTGGSRGTALSAAAYHGRYEIVKILIPRSFTWWRHGTAFQEATQGGHFETVQLLLDEGADFNSPFGITDNLANAIRGGHERVVRLLFDKGAKIENSLAMKLAAGQGHTEVVRLLIERQQTAMKKTNDSEKKIWAQAGMTAAASAGYEQIVRMILEVGSNVYLTPALMAASRFGHLNVFQILFDRLQYVDWNTWHTALREATFSRHYEIIKFLCDWNSGKGYQVNVELLTSATKDGNTDVVKMLVGLVDNINIGRESRQGWESPLYTACKSGNLLVVQILLEAGASMGVEGNPDRSPLVAAASNRFEEIVELLLIHGFSDDALAIDEYSRQLESGEIFESSECSRAQFLIDKWSSWRLHETSNSEDWPESWKPATWHAT